MAKFCSECGKPILREGSPFCSECGAKISLTPPIEQKPVIQTITDQQSAHPSWYIPPVSSASTPVQTQTRQKQDSTTENTTIKASTIKWIAICSGIVILVVIIAAFMAGSAPTPPTPTGTTLVTSPVTRPVTPSVTPSVTPGIQVTLDHMKSASTRVSSEGAVLSVTPSGAARSTLTVPPTALPSAVTITLIPISAIQGLPINGTFIGGVRMIPDGLQFSTPSTLAVQIPAGTSAERLIGITFSSDGKLFQLKPVEVKGSQAEILIDHFSNAGVFTVIESMADVTLHCAGGDEGSIIKRREYFESSNIQSCIRSGSAGGEEYEEFEFIETTGDPQGPHGTIWDYIDQNGRHFSRVLQYNADESLSYQFNQIDGEDVNSSELDKIFTKDFAKSCKEPVDVADALDRLRAKTCGSCDSVRTVTVSPDTLELGWVESKQLVAEVRDAQGNLLKECTIHWTSSDEKAVYVAPCGTVTRRGPGTAVITATVGGRSGSATISFPEKCPIEGTWNGEFLPNSSVTGQWYVTTCTFLTNKISIVISRDLDLYGNRRFKYSITGIVREKCQRSEESIKGGNPPELIRGSEFSGTGFQGFDIRYPELCPRRIGLSSYGFEKYWDMKQGTIWKTDEYWFFGGFGVEDSYNQLAFEILLLDNDKLAGYMRPSHEHFELSRGGTVYTPQHTL